MKKLVSFYIYFIPASLGVLLLLALFSQQPRYLVQAIFPTIIVYFLITGYRRGKTSSLYTAGAFWGLISAILAFILISNFRSKDAGLGLTLFPLFIFTSVGCYLTIFRKATKIELSQVRNQHLSDEYNNRTFAYKVNDQEIYRSKSYYWYEDQFFNSAKKVEAYITQKFE